MKAKVIYCDICKERIIGNDGDVRIKYKAKMCWYLWYESGWLKIDICKNCLTSIIKAKQDIDNHIAL